MDIIRVLRLIEYEGPRDQVEEQVKRSIHGEKRVKGITISAVTLHAFPKIVETAPAITREHVTVFEDGRMTKDDLEAEKNR